MSVSSLLMPSDFIAVKYHHCRCSLTFIDAPILDDFTLGTLAYLAAALFCSLIAIQYFPCSMFKRESQPQQSTSVARYSTPDQIAAINLDEPPTLNSGEKKMNTKSNGYISFT